MSRVLRTILLWMLAFSIPASGFAASAPPWCGVVAEQVARHDVAVGAAMHGHADVLGHKHTRAGDTPASAGTDAADVATASTPAAANAAPAVSCHTCAAHCSAAAIAARFSPFEPNAPSHHYGSTVLASTIDVVHDGLERPPRTALL